VVPTAVPERSGEDRMDSVALGHRDGNGSDLGRVEQLLARQ
jgi:hypothetical protein